MDHVWAPPPEESITYKHDLRMGAHDPLLWPQWYISQFGYLAAIRRRPASLDKNNPFSIAFHTLQDCDLVLTQDGAIGGLYVLNHTLLTKAEAFIRSEIDKKFEDYMKGPDSGKDHVLRTFPPSIHRNFTYLKDLPMSRRQIMFIFAELQRYLLEFTAVYDFLTIYLPRSEQGRLSTTKVDQGVMGALVDNVAVAEKLFQMGIPVWLIRPAKYAGTIRVDEVVEALNPSDFLCLENATFLYPIEFRGQLTDPERYMTFGRYARQFLSYSITFHSLDSSTFPSQIAAPLSSSHRHQNKPCVLSYCCVKIHLLMIYRLDHNTKQKPNIEEPVSELMPRAPAYWLKAVQHIVTDPNRKRCAPSSDAQRGYILPQPSLFLGTATSTKRNTYISNWLQYRSMFLYRLTTASGQSFLKGQLWRDILNTSPNTSSPQNSSASTTSSASTKAQKRRELINSILPKSVTDADNLQIRDYETSPVLTSWRGQALTFGQDFEAQTVREILWEISELNFRFDLLSLDRHLYRFELDEQTKMHRYASAEDRILLCLPRGASSSLLVADIADAGSGLASTDWAVRRQAMVALQIVMRSWEGFAEFAPEGSFLSTWSGDILRC